MVIDVAISVGSDTKTYSIPETLSTTYYGDTCISTDMQTILREIDQLYNQAEAAISSVPTWEQIKQQCSDLRDNLNPEIKEKKLLDQRMTKLEGNMSEMRGNMSEMKDMFKQFMKKFE